MSEAAKILEVVSRLVSRGLSHSAALEEARFIAELFAPTPRSSRSPEAKRLYERERKAAYRERVSQMSRGHVPGTAVERESSILTESVVKEGKKDSPRPAVPRDNGDKSDWPTDYREQFWKTYPKRVEKQAAFRKLEAIKRGGAVPWAEFFGGVMRYAAQCTGKESRYVKHPTTWLNKGCWSDEPERGLNGENWNGGGKDLGFSGIAATLRAQRLARTIDETTSDVRAGDGQGPPELPLVRLEDGRGAAAHPARAHRR